MSRHGSDQAACTDPEAGTGTPAVDVRDQLVALVGHDLRNPLTAMLLGVRRLRGQARLSHDEHELLMRVTRSGERMARMLDQLVDYVRVRIDERIPLERRECALDEVCRRVVEELELIYPEVTIALDAPATLLGRFDEERLAEVLSNLVGNACEHGGGPIAVRLCRGIGVAVVTVSNGGPAIPAELLPHVFEPFRGRRTTRRSSGLGLFLTRALVEAHDGAIAVESQAGFGTRFTVTLPLS
jgi:signal transduction histidine kinase